MKRVLLLGFIVLFMVGLQGKVFAQSKTKLLPVLSPAKTVIVNSINHRFLFAGTTRISYPIILPVYTKSWYYRIVVEPRDAQAAQTQDLLKGLMPLLSSNPYALATGAALKFLTPLPRTESCHFYLFNKASEKEKFDSFLENFVPKHQELHVQSTYGYLEAKPNEELWVAFRNQNQMQGIKVSLEVVAIVGWSEANIKQVERQIKVSPFELKNGTWLEDSQSLSFLAEETLLQIIKKFTPDEFLPLSEVERRDIINLTIEEIGNKEFVPATPAK